MRRLGLLLGVALTWAPWLLYDLILNCPFYLNDMSIYFIFRDYSTVFLTDFYFDSDPTQSARWSSLWSSLEADLTPGEETQNSIVLGLENVTTLTLNLV